MSLVKFQHQVGASSIRARDLDANFERLQPVPNGTYGVNQTEQGWSLNIFPAYPESVAQALYLTYTGGGLQWRSIEQNEGVPPGTISPGAISPGSLPVTTISPGANGSLLITEDNTARWSLPPPTGTPAWRAVERCDGKIMYVWATEWED
jgi:hypothetical protein